MLKARPKKTSMLAHRESTDLASRLVRESVEKQNVDRNQLTIHSDRGTSMTSQGVAQLLASLGVGVRANRPAKGERPGDVGTYRR